MTIGDFDPVPLIYQQVRHHCPFTKARMVSCCESILSAWVQNVRGTILVPSCCDDRRGADDQRNSAAELEERLANAKRQLRCDTDAVRRADSDPDVLAAVLERAEMSRKRVAEIRRE